MVNTSFVWYLLLNINVPSIRCEHLLLMEEELLLPVSLFFCFVIYASKPFARAIIFKNYQANVHTISCSMFLPPEKASFRKQPCHGLCRQPSNLVTESKKWSCPPKKGYYSKGKGPQDFFINCFLVSAEILLGPIWFPLFTGSALHFLFHSALNIALEAYLNQSETHPAETEETCMARYENVEVTRIWKRLLVLNYVLMSIFIQQVIFFLEVLYDCT